MSYERLNLKYKDKFTAEHLAHLEDGIAAPTNWIDIVDNPLISKNELIEVWPETTMEYDVEMEGYTLPSSPKLQAGHYYTLIYNGEKWEHLQAQSYMGMLTIITNPGAKLNANSPEEANMLFALMQYNTDGLTGFMINTEEPPETLTLQIFHELITPAKLDPIWLPAGVPYSDGNSIGKTEILPESTLERSPMAYDDMTIHFISSSLSAIEVGHIYEVQYNGQCYELEAYIAEDAGESFVALGEIGTSFPFFIIVFPKELEMPAEGAVYAWDHAPQVTLAISAPGGLVQKLPHECLPSGVPVYYEGVQKRTLLSDLELTRDEDEDGDLVMGRLALQPFVEYELIVNGKHYTSICQESRNSSGEITAYVLGMDNPLCQVYVVQQITDIVPDYVNTMVIWRDNMGLTITFSLNEYMPYTHLTPLDQRCFPTDLSVIHLLSPSGKKFAISVSDDGNLSATEVI